MKVKWIYVGVLFLLAGLILAACSSGPQTVEVTRVNTVTEVVEVPGGETVVEVTRVVTDTVVDTVVETVVVEPEPVDRNGSWLDTIVFVEEPNQDSAVARLAAGDIDMYADDIGGQAAVQAIGNADNVTAVTQFGLFDEIFFNNGTCADENVLNPFQNRTIREAMNWAINRDFVADELYAGLAVPKYTPIAEAGADRSRFAAEIRAIEAKYAYDFERAREIVNTEMEAMGAEMVDGVWTFGGEPITLIGLIRVEDTRLEIGNYFANQLEELGFTVERLERTSSELSPLWIESDPTECQWNWYTGGWSQTSIQRNNANNFDFYYTPRGVPWPSWQVFEPTEEFDELSLRLFNNDYADLEERAELFRQILPMAGEMATRVWVTSRTTLVPYSDQVEVSADLAAGISGTGLWAKTARFADQVGGSMTIGLPSVFTEPWNPIGGSNWVFDNMVQRALGEQSRYSDPHTGIAIPGRLERAEIVVREGFPTNVTLDWVDLSFAPEIVVPDDAWVSWDAENQVFLTAAEVYTETQTAVYKSTAYYPEDLYDTISWHDGSPISAADFVMGMIVAHDLGNPDSPYYDESLEPGLAQFLSSFKGFRILSADPLVIEHYSDAAGLDAENLVWGWWPGTGAGDAYGFADAAWHNMAVMLRGEANGGFAFTPDKADANEVERTNMIAGPSLQVFADELSAATEEGFIPYEPTLGQFITAEEAAARYANLAEFARRYGHYYIGTNVYFLQGVFPVESQAILQRYQPHPDPANRYSGFADPAIPVVEVDGPGSVTIGEDATFEIFVDLFDGPYPLDDIESVTYLLFDATGTQVASGTAEAVEDGLWEVTLGSDTTATLEEGATRLEVVVTSKLVALPSLGEYQFVTTP